MKEEEEEDPGRDGAVIVWSRLKDEEFFLQGVLEDTFLPTNVKYSFKYRCLMY